MTIRGVVQLTYSITFIATGRHPPSRQDAAAHAPRYGRPAKGSRYFGRKPFRLRGPEEALYPLGQQCDA